MSNVGDRQICEFQLLKYVPDPVRNEFVHIGVLLRESGAGRPAAPLLRFTRDWRRVRCLNEDADTALFENMESELCRRFQAEPEGNLERILNEALSTSVQMTTPKGYYAESLPAGMDELMRLYVESPPRERVSRLSGRAAIQTQMRTEFEKAGVWDLLLKRIPASKYTLPGDPLRIDLAYRPNGMIRMFHAVSLESGVEMAKVLALSAPSLYKGIEEKESAELQLTAIIEPAAQLNATDQEPERLEMYRFGVEIMEAYKINVATTTALGNIASAARRELRA